MCISCGCGKNEDDHGDQRNLTTRSVEQAAQAAGISSQQVFENFQKASKSSAGAGSQGSSR